MSRHAESVLLRSLLVSTLTVFGCQTPVSLGGPAKLEVVVLQGFATPTAPLDQLGSSVTVVADSSSREALQRAATFVDALPARVRVEAIASAPTRHTETCRVGRSVSAPTPAQVASRLATLATADSASLSAALAAWQADRDASSASDRVVIFSAFDEEPEGCPDLCSTAATLAAEGVSFDWVAVGDQRAPACLAELPRPEGAGPIATALAPTPPTFQVRTGPGMSGDGLAAGRAGDTVTLLPGTVTIHFDLDPPEQVGPLDVEHGDRLRLVLVDFPMASPPHRSWWVEEPAGAVPASPLLLPAGPDVAEGSP